MTLLSTYIECTIHFLTYARLGGVELVEVGHARRVAGLQHGLHAVRDLAAEPLREDESGTDPLPR